MSTWGGGSTPGNGTVSQDQCGESGPGEGGGSTPGNGTISQDQCGESGPGEGREDLPQGTGPSHRTSVVSQGTGEGGRIHPREWDSLTGSVW